MSDGYVYSKMFSWLTIAIGSTVLVCCVCYTAMQDIPGNHPAPQKDKLPPLCNNGSLQYHSKESQLPNVIHPRCTVVVVVPKCTVVVQHGVVNKSPLSRVVEKNIKKEVVLERGGKTDIFDMVLFE